MTELPEDLARRFQINDTPCWSWTGARQSKGYGSITNGRGGSMLVHRRVWESVYGPIPDGMTIDHLCRNKLCGRPDHLRLVTAADNVRAAGSSVTACVQGHEYTPDNTISHSKTGTRSCRECQRQRSARRRKEVGE